MNTPLLSRLCGTGVAVFVFVAGIPATFSDDTTPTYLKPSFSTESQEKSFILRSQKYLAEQIKSPDVDGFLTGVLYHDAMGFLKRVYPYHENFKDEERKLRVLAKKLMIQLSPVGAMIDICQSEKPSKAWDESDLRDQFYEAFRFHHRDSLSPIPLFHDMAIIPVDQQLDVANRIWNYEHSERLKKFSCDWLVQSESELLKLIAEFRSVALAKLIVLSPKKAMTLWKEQLVKTQAPWTRQAVFEQIISAYRFAAWTIANKKQIRVGYSPSNFYGSPIPRPIEWTEGLFQLIIVDNPNWLKDYPDLKSTLDLPKDHGLTLHPQAKARIYEAMAMAHGFHSFQSPGRKRTASSVKMLRAVFIGTGMNKQLGKSKKSDTGDQLVRDIPDEMYNALLGYSAYNGPEFTSMNLKPNPLVLAGASELNKESLK